jgi:hypothetical protein
VWSLSFNYWQSDFCRESYVSGHLVGVTNVSFTLSKSGTWMPSDRPFLDNRRNQTHTYRMSFLSTASQGLNTSRSYSPTSLHTFRNASTDAYGWYFELFFFSMEGETGTERGEVSLCPGKLLSSRIWWETL